MIDPRVEARWAEIDPLLDALQDQPTERRERWLQDHCHDGELRSLVLALLAADAVRAADLEACVASTHAWLEERVSDFPDIPGYRVLALVGEGGMASVFLAERRLGETVQRVALKRLRLNIYDQDERRRFEHEHKVLARLEHSSIARLLDAGIGPDGVPWFAMEFVEGQSLVAWCDSRKIGLAARLALFIDVCAAVQHAHQHLVIHRDLKPSNILVDHDGQVKLLDFGIARMLEADTDRPDGTRTELRRLTPGYAAPEQYAGTTSTATDVYALGVVLLELLSGRKPVAIDSDRPGLLQSTAITDQAADARDTSPGAIRRLLAGDLGTIVRKATRTEPSLRYSTAQALADDVAALRAGRAVAARHGDWRYRASCFIRRNKAAVAVGLLFAVTLVAATGISLYQASEARMQAARAVAVQDFVERMLTPLRTGVSEQRIPRLDEVLAQGVRDLEARRQRDPVVYSELLMMFASTYDRMDDPKTALDLATRLHAHNSEAFDADDPRTLRALALRGRLQAMNNGDAVRRRADVESLLARMRQRGVTGVALAEVLDDLAHLESGAGRKYEAVALFTQALAERERELGPDHPDLAISYANIGNAQFAFAPPAVSRGWYEKAHRHVVRHAGPDTRDAAYYLGRIAAADYYAGELRESERGSAAALAIFDRLGMQASAERLGVLIGTCDEQLDTVLTAPAACDAVVDAIKRQERENHAAYINSSRFLVQTLALQGRLREAREVAARVRASLAATPGEIAARRLDLFNLNYSEVELIDGDYATMRDNLARALREINGSFPRLIPVWTARLALACARAPAPACPPDLSKRVRAQLDAQEFRTHPRRIEMQLPLAQLAIDRGEIAQAHAYLDDVQAVAAQPRLRFPPGHWRLVEARMLRGDAFAAQGDQSAAVREWQAAEAVFAARYAADHPYLLRLRSRLAGQVARD